MLGENLIMLANKGNMFLQLNKKNTFSKDAKLLTRQGDGDNYAGEKINTANDLWVNPFLYFETKKLL